MISPCHNGDSTSCSLADKSCQISSISLTFSGRLICFKSRVADITLVSTSRARNVKTPRLICHRRLSLRLLVFCSLRLSRHLPTFKPSHLPTAAPHRLSREQNSPSSRAMRASSFKPFSTWQTTSAASRDQTKARVDGSAAKLRHCRRSSAWRGRYQHSGYPHRGPPASPRQPQLIAGPFCGPDAPLARSSIKFRR
jgi:hypothetical protein